MKNELSKKLKRYYKLVKKQLRCSSEEKEQILSSLKNDIEEFLIHNPSADFQDLIDHFGEPEIFFKSYIDSLGQNEIYDKLKRSKIKKRIIVLGIICLILIVICTSIIIIHVNNQQVGLYYGEAVSINL